MSKGCLSSLIFWRTLFSYSSLGSIKFLVKIYYFYWYKNLVFLTELYLRVVSSTDLLISFISYYFCLSLSLMLPLLASNVLFLSSILRFSYYSSYFLLCSIVLIDLCYLTFCIFLFIRMNLRISFLCWSISTGFSTIIDFFLRSLSCGSGLGIGFLLCIFWCPSKISK